MILNKNPQILCFPGRGAFPKCLVPGTWYLVPFPKCLVPGSHSQDKGAGYFDQFPSPFIAQSYVGFTAAFPVIIHHKAQSDSTKDAPRSRWLELRAQMAGRLTIVTATCWHCNTAHKVEAGVVPGWFKVGSGPGWECLGGETQNQLCTPRSCSLYPAATYIAGVGLRRRTGAWAACGQIGKMDYTPTAPGHAVGWRGIE